MAITLEDAVRDGLDAAKAKLENGAKMVAIGKASLKAGQTYAEWKTLFDARWEDLQLELSTDHGVRIKVIHPIADDPKMFLKFAAALTGRHGNKTPDLEVDLSDRGSLPDDIRMP